MGKHDDYAGALDDLERLRQQGKITQGQYEVHRQRLQDEMRQRPWPIGIRILLILVFIAVVLFIFRGCSAGLSMG